MAGSPARKEVGRVGVRVVPDTSGFAEELNAQLAKSAGKEIDVKVNGEFTKLEADLQRITAKQRSLTIKVQANVAAAEAAINRLSRERTAKIKVDVQTGAAEAAISRAAQKLSKLGGGQKIKLNVELDDAKAVARLAVLTRTQAKKIKVDLDVSSLDQANKALSGFGSAVTSALSGAASLLASLSSGFQTIASSATATASAVATAGSGMSGVLSGVSGVALSVVGSIAQLAGMAVAITALIALLGSVVVAAGAAAVAIGGVVIGVGSLITLPAVFAGIAASIISGSKELKAEFSALKDSIAATIGETAVPMIGALRDALQTINDAISEGTPLYDGLALAFEAASGAIGPLTEGLLSFAENALTGVANALNDLNAQGFWDGIATGLGTLGEAFGSFFSGLAAWAPEFSASFQAIADAALLLLPSIANLAGVFSSFAPSVITTIAEAFKSLFDSFAQNKDVYGTAAQSFADALNRMAGPLEDVAAAFAKMAPEIMSTMASAFESFAETLSNPDTIQGLTDLTEALILVGGKAAEVATELAASTGNALEEVGTYWDKLTGVLQISAQVSIEHLQGLVDQADSTTEAAHNLQRQLAVSLAEAVKAAEDDMGKIALAYERGWNQMLQTGDTAGAQLNQGFSNTMNSLLQELAYTDGQMSADWAAAMNNLLTQMEQSGDPLAQSMAANMRKILGEIEMGKTANVEQVRQMLLEMDNQVQASQIATILGIKLDEAKGQVDTKGQAVQDSFRQVMDALPEMIRNAKTPEELQTKLTEMTTIVSNSAPAMGTAFKALGDSMSKGLADADVAKGATTLMTAVQTAITAAVPGVVTAFQQLPTQLATAMATGSTGVTAAVTTQMTNITQAVTKGVTDSVTAYKKLPTDMAAASDFSQTNEKVKTAMDTAKKDVETNVKAMVDELKKLPEAGKEAGKLGNMASAIKSELDEAKGAVQSAVREILSQLEQLNQTFTTNIVVNVTRNEEGGDGGGEEGFAAQSFAMAAPAMPMVEPVEPFALAAAPMSLSEQASAAEAIVGYARALRDSRKESAAASQQPQKVYNITIQAAPNVPTEEQLRKQLAYADALYE